MAEEKRKAAANLQDSSLRIMKERLGSKEEELQRAKEILEENKKNKAKKSQPQEINLEEEEEVVKEEPLNSALFQPQGKRKTPPKEKANPNHQPQRRPQEDVHPLHAGLMARQAQASQAETGQSQSQGLPRPTQQQQQQQSTTQGMAQWLQSQDFTQQQQQALEQKQQLEQQQQEREEAFKRHQQEEQQEFAKEQEELMQSVCQIQAQLSQPPNPPTPTTYHNQSQTQQSLPQAHCVSEDLQLRMQITPCQRNMVFRQSSSCRPKKIRLCEYISQKKYKSLAGLEPYQMEGQNFGNLQWLLDFLGLHIIAVCSALNQDPPPPVTANICSILNLKTDDMFVSNVGKLKQLQILDFLPQHHGQKKLNSVHIRHLIKLKTHPPALKSPMTPLFLNPLH